jgi:hypothetical protein
MTINKKWFSRSYLMGLLKVVWNFTAANILLKYLRGWPLGI